MKKNNFRPRDILNQDIAGICGVAKMTDKARAAYTAEIGSYKYGADSEQDTEILSFLEITADAFQDAAVRLTNDVKLGAWILDTCEKSSEEISKFNRKLKYSMHRKNPQNGFSKRRRELNDREPSIPIWISPGLWLVSKVFRRW
ncbi:DUF5069 domain-containing protein [Candidatus Poribacteria bacterium]|nr:DUF5069 domain-containing protein [Candidatus Poribacteria bacterium]